MKKTSWVSGGVLHEFKPQPVVLEKKEEEQRTAAELYDEVLSSTPAQTAKRRSQKKIELTRKKVSEGTSFWCKDCQKQIEDTSLQDHIRSLAHLVELKKPAVSIPYALNASNVGFRLLRDSGWQIDQGLGRNNEGRKEPIATALKSDRAGLGASLRPPRKLVTHPQAELERHQMTLRTTRMKQTPVAKAAENRREMKNNEKWRRSMFFYMTH